MDEKRQTVTEQLDALIAEYNGSARDALNHTLAKLEAAQAELAQLRAERDAADYLLAEGEAHAPADFDGEVQRLRDTIAELRRFGNDAEAEVQRLRESLAEVVNVFDNGFFDGYCEWADIARAALEVKYERPFPPPPEPPQ